MVSNPEIMPFSETRKEVNEEPEVVARVLAEQANSILEISDWLVKKQIQRIYLIGSGDSGFSGMCAKLAFERYAGLPCEVLQAFEYAAYGDVGVDEKSCAVVISSSGRKSTTRDALERAIRSGACVVGITDSQEDENPFIAHAHQAIVPGAKKLGWPTQTTLATLASLYHLALELGKARGFLANKDFSQLQGELFDLPQKMRSVLEASRFIVEQAVAQYGNADCWLFVGSGPNLGAAWIGSALMAEGPQRVGLALSVEEFHHSLREFTLSENAPVMLLSSGNTILQRNLETCRAVKSRKAGLILVMDETSLPLGEFGDMVFQMPVVPEAFSPLLTVLPLHELSLGLTRLRIEQGHQRPSVTA